MRTQENMTTYRTADFNVICTLHYLGFVIEGFERDMRSPGRIAVYFKHSQELDAALQSIWSKEQRVEPLTFLEITRTMKARMRECA